MGGETNAGRRQRTCLALKYLIHVVNVVTIYKDLQRLLDHHRKS